jgi:Outer membrane protein beta-barrel domain
MKKVLLSLVIVFVGLCANAQVKFGAKGGMNLATLGGDGTNGADLSSLVSFHIGGLVSIPVATNFSIQPEVYYSGEGTKVGGTSGGNYLFNYLNVPVLAKYKIVKGLSVEAGPQLGFILSAKIKDNSGNETDVKSELKSTDFSVALGANYIFDNNLGIDVRYNIGLTDINTTTGTNSTLTNDVFQVGVFYLFNTK